ncbi:Uu.00g035990.m01.CDS01 [Anthostomella pinea]|uniref:Uu.00g035990.m01.CDS01 n=1 Tax=Anthostomella pinea TaxID=933095 RepID=A0AAI8YDF1_9PEZI|nr:Uu.00g035990.m01.CDS01 [Anthostomella pinea]
MSCQTIQATVQIITPVAGTQLSDQEISEAASALSGYSTAHRNFTAGDYFDIPAAPSGVSSEWPLLMRSPLAWTPTSIAEYGNFIFCLSQGQKEEVTQALNFFKGLHLDARYINPKTFPLPSLATRLRGVSHDLYYGKGFVIIRGLDPNEFSKEDNALVFLGISSHIAPQHGAQTKQGHMMVHVVNADSTIAPLESRQSLYTNLAQPFHSDVFSEILALQTMGCSVEGGDSLVVSSWAIYNELASTRPDVIRTLAAADWPFDTYGQDPPYYQRPLLFYQDNRIILNFSRRLLVGSDAFPRSAGIPSLSLVQSEALEAVNTAAEKNQVRIKMEAGDLRFINNLAMLHARDSFENDDKCQRHLVRLWLRDPENSWRIPLPLHDDWARVYGNQVTMEGKWPVGLHLTREQVVDRQASCGQG